MEVGGLEVSSRAELPSLAELCVRSVHREKLGELRGQQLIFFVVIFCFCFSGGHRVESNACRAALCWVALVYFSHNHRASGLLL